MTRISLGIVYIFIKIVNFGFSYVNAELREINCKMTGIKLKKERVQQTTFISAENFTSITEGDEPSSTEHMPSAPRELKVTSHENFATVYWYSPRSGFKYVRHFLLTIEEVVDGWVHHEYILVTVRGLNHSTTKVSCDFKLRHGSKVLTSTVWAFGPIIVTKNSHMTADVDKFSKSETVSENTDKVYLQRHDKAKQCICSDLLLSAKAFPSSITYTIRSETLPNGTKIKIQLLKSIGTTEADVEENVITATMNRNFDGSFKINTTGNYSIRVQRLCNSEFKHIVCDKSQKSEAEVIRSKPILVLSFDNSEQSTLPSKFHLPLKLKQKQWIQSMDVVSLPLEPEVDDMNKILQLVIIIVGFSLAAIIETAIIIKFCSVIIQSRKKSSKYYKHPTCVTVDVWGRTSTRVLKPRRVAIIFTKDTVEHVSRVYQLKSSLRRLGIDATPYDENIVPGMRLNWIQVGENIATESDVVLFIISPSLIKLCKQHDDSIENETDVNVSNTPLHKLPVVVLNSLKVGNITRGKSKPRVISVYLSQTNSSFKHMTTALTRDHPSLMCDDALLQYDKKDNEINISHIKKLANKIKA